MRFYQTQSLYEASFLLAKGFKLTSKQFNGQKASLIFEDTPALQQAVMDFYNGTGIASAKGLFDQYRNCKDMIFQR